MIATPASGAKAAWPLAAICCLGIVAFTIAAMVIVALIPLYLPQQSSSSSSTTTDSSPFYVAYTGSSSSLTTDNNLAGNVLNTDQVGTQLGVSSLGKIQSGQAQPMVTRRRRGVVNQRDKRGLATSILFKCATIFAATCTSTACRTAAIDSFKAQLKQTFSNILLTVNISSTQNTTNSYTLVFLSFYNESTKPTTGYGVASSTNFTASQTGLFNNASTWIGGIVPYGNCSVIIPSGYTVTIAGSSLDIRVITFYVNGTLAVGQGNASFQFTYATSIIIVSGGSFQDLTSTKTITFAQESYLVALSNGSTPNGTVIIVGGSSRTVGDSARLSCGFGPCTVGVVSTTLYTFRKVTHVCRRSGTLLSPLPYFGGFAPTGPICSVAGCGLLIGPGATLSASDVVGTLTIQIDTMTVASGGIFSLGTSSVSGFSFGTAFTMHMYGQLLFAGIGGVIRTPIGSFINFYTGSTFTSSISVSIQPFDPRTGSNIGIPLVLGTSFSGPFYVTVPMNGIIQTGATADTTPFYVEYTASSSSLTTDNNLAGSLVNLDQVASSLGMTSLGILRSCQAQPTTTRRKREVVNQRDKRALITKILCQCSPSFTSDCTDSSCRIGVINSFKTQLSNNFTNILLTVNASSSQNTTNTYTLVFVAFYNESTKPTTGYGVASSTNFTASRTGLFNNASIWIGGIVPYGNCTVIIPSGYTVTIAGSLFEIRVITFDVSGTLAVGLNSSTFQFLYPTSIIIKSGGAFVDLTTTKTINLAQESNFVALSNAAIPTGSTIVTGSGSGATGQSVLIGGRVGPYTVAVYSSNVYSYQKVTYIVRRTGQILSPLPYLAGFVPTPEVCGNIGCDVLVGSGATLLTSNLNGILNIPISTVNVAAGCSFSMGTSGVNGFSFTSIVALQAYGQLIFSGSGGVIRLPIGSALNFYSGSTFTSSVAISFQSYDPLTNINIGTPLVLGTSVSGPLYVTIPLSGIIQTSTTVIAVSVIITATGMPPTATGIFG